MKYKNMNGEAIMFPLAEGERVVVGAMYEINTEGKAVICESSVAQHSGYIVGICKGGDKIEKGMIMLDINPTSIFRDKLTFAAPNVGTYVGSHKLVIAVDEEANEYEFILRKS